MQVKVLCYNWMPFDDWSRTSVVVEERGSALVSEFNLDKIEEKEDHDNTHMGKFGGQVLTEKKITAPELWANLEYFLKKVISFHVCSSMLIGDTRLRGERSCACSAS